MTSDEFAQFVPLKGFEEDYEIQTTYPYNIKKKSNQRIIAEGEYRQNGYICVNLNQKIYYKHILIAKQFLSNPDNLPQVDHKNRDRTDYHIDNLRFISNSDNGKNKRRSTINENIVYEYVDEIPDESIVVDFYDSKFNHYEFENYFFHDDVFFFYNGVQYRKLHINEFKVGSKFVSMIDVDNRRVHVYINKFKQQHDLI